jgi:hypothetical protein
MQLPGELIGFVRPELRERRDALIVQLAHPLHASTNRREQGLSARELSIVFDLSEQRVRQIVGSS